MIYAAILGFGTVGSGVAELLSMNKEEIRRTCGEEIAVKRIVDVRDFPGSRFAPLMTKSFGDVEADPEISIVAETIGGSGVAYEFSKRALAAGKSVITSNKQLVAEHGPELMALAQEKGVSYLFEASVGGGIPVLNPITACLGQNRLEEVCGILNGTTNYILTQMFQNGMAFEDALSRAQELGYAERNPHADISGQDTCRKTAILAALCFGRYVNPDGIPTQGIEAVTGTDVALAAKKGYSFRLLGRSLRTGDDTVTAYVAPHLIRDGSLLSGVTDVVNGILIRGNCVGTVAFCGPGAGKLPTASAVAADIVSAAKNPGTGYPAWAEEKEGYLTDPALLKSRWFVRGKGKAGDGLSLVGNADGWDGYISDSMDKAGIDGACAGMETAGLFRILDIE